MSKGHIALVMLWETFYTCLITIAGGLLLGILLSKLILLLLYKVLFFTVSFGFYRELAVGGDHRPAVRRHQSGGPADQPPPRPPVQAGGAAERGAA